MRGEHFSFFSTPSPKILFPSGIFALFRYESRPRLPHQLRLANLFCQLEYPWQRAIWRGGIKDGKERTTREENERKILLSVIFLARPLSLSFVLRYRRNRSVIIWRLFGYIYPNIYPNGPPTFPLGKIKYLAALTVALRGRIPFVSQRRTSYIVSNSASRHRDYREERSGGREGGRGRKRKESKNVTCSTRYREISPLLKYNEARNLRIKGSCFQWRHD